ncbi:cysteine--tRNA ligase [Tyzzerella sp. An114]|uniref:cysteine--tRNA ligase n=1 Tax=Tyzzerella sp. An114 TaxID=1965545 RepID=UPI000B44318E|nr:cysteine--tRNA ligase [Tyzzerella sp. An114]OUQ57195.1 cysteine--tRNA ligase [Tyzzerella sp. An114]HIT73650.1 cysteine--tRNA ligase [Candidatus Fimicola cottocaccae]
MKLYNTLTRKKEEFVPMEEGKVKMYVCGPTVYNFIHIGNARPYVVFDTVRRYFEYKGYDVTYVQNFTDVDDKIIKKANEENTTMDVIANRYIEEAFTDADGLNVKRATVHPRVTQEIENIIKMISELIEKGYAYEDNGTVYFDTKAFNEYGKLSKKNLDELIAGASERVQQDDAKKNSTDFVLWKPQKPGEPKWSSPWGDGRPGWHIECSVMAKKYLGETIDIHAGGEDLIFPHHENEIAQSECCNGKPFARYWLHNGFITVDNEKMSKSAGNFFTVRDIVAHFPYEVIRFFILNGHYRMPINFSDELMKSCQNGLERIKNCKNSLVYYIDNCKKADMTEDEEKQLAEIDKFRVQFEEAMDDDFNTADAITAIYELVRFINKSITDEVSKAFAEKEMEMFNRLTSVLGLLEKEKEKTEDPDTAMIEELIAKRTEAKKNKDFATADAIREELSQMGITIKDTRQGVQWFRG